ncbi:thiamine phosphate synthase [Microvirga lotononidis]|uniref:Thiamine monophosphate synthase n=1 Tax=Microvirga lotononidis TaxID=864069 RepID=I4YTT0_9HYPH|nr:thiamine phosphate synthase [Microvirga lotononidis]EIM27372.1 thiamine monophosphate synthase [Microvirga lotononidis]WQO28459.1 thiamine phosphate synthase [Microvirga lotononidis]
MADTAARLYLITPVLEDSSFAPRLAEACGAGSVAAVLLRLAPADERSLINLVKALAPAAQEHGAAVLVSSDGKADLANVAARGGADGVHVPGDPALVRELRERLKSERAVGVGAIRTKDDAMTLGEAGADYLLFGEPRPDGSLPSLESVVERASWWAEIFETPCVAYAPSLDAVEPLAATNAEFVALGDAVWTHAEGPAAAVKAAAEILERQEATR